MKLSIENLGYIKKAEIVISPLTIVCGKNNTGKTYLSYTIYGLLAMANGSTWGELRIDKAHFEELQKNGSTKINIQKYVAEDILTSVFKNISDIYSKQLDRVFSCQKEIFENTKIDILPREFKPSIEDDFTAELKFGKKNILSAKKLENSDIVEISVLNEVENNQPLNSLRRMADRLLSLTVLNCYLKNPVIITSERTGIQLFYKDLDSRKNVIVDTLIEGKGRIDDPFELLDKYVSRYPRPIQDNIDYVRDYERIRKSKSFLFNTNQKNSELISAWEDILEGKIGITNNQLFFSPSMRNERKKIKIPLYLGSSAIKSLISLDLYLRHMAAPHDILMIDEPELNLHPDNQRKLARIIARLINKGIFVFITTHSDYFLKEINNLILLSNQFRKKQEIMNEYGYSKEEILNSNSVAVYIMKNRSAEQAEVTSKGIQKSSFDEVIISQDKASDELYYSLDEE